MLEGAVAQQEPRRIAANSGYLQPFVGERWLAGRPDFVPYVQRPEAIRNSYLLNLDLHYRMEQRWPDSEFWFRRHRGSPVAAGSPEG